MGWRESPCICRGWSLSTTSLGRHPSGQVTYGDVYHQNEVEMSRFNFQEADIDYLFSQFEFCEKEAMRLAQNELPLPAYEHVMKASHTFNLLDARHAIGVTERQRYILRVRALARAAAEAYVAARGALGFPQADPDLAEAALQQLAKSQGAEA